MLRIDIYVINQLLSSLFLLLSSTIYCYPPGEHLQYDLCLFYLPPMYVDTEFEWSGCR